MKTLKLTCLATLLTLAGFTATTDANADRPGAAKAKPSRGAASRSRYAPLNKADLRCTIQAFEDAAGMKPIANGQSLGYGGGAPKVYVRVIVENAGKLDANGFKNTVSVKRGGANIFSTNETLNIPKGLAKIYPLVAVTLPSVTNNISATISADSGKSVSEANEYNNSCSFSTTATVVH